MLSAAEREVYEERAAMMEYHGGLSRSAAEAAAGEAMGFGREQDRSKTDRSCLTKDRAVEQARPNMDRSCLKRTGQVSKNTVKSQKVATPKQEELFRVDSRY